ncbi:hypothetical protein HKD37_15G043809 [Glycine soja]
MGCSKLSFESKLRFVTCLITLQINITSAANLFAQVNCLSMLNGTNLRNCSWLYEFEFGLGTKNRTSTSTLKTSNKTKIEKWDRSNPMCIMIMKCYILDEFRGLLVHQD